MGLWFLCTLIFTIFSGLYFTLDKERLAPSEDRQTAMAGLFDNCRTAAMRHAQENDGFGLARIDVPCSSATGALRDGGIPNLNVPGVIIRAQPASNIVAGASGRIIVTYIPINAPVMNGIPFSEAARQIRSVYGAETATGIVADTPGGHRIDNGDGTIGAAVPLDIATGSFATVRLVDP